MCLKVYLPTILNYISGVNGKYCDDSIQLLPPGPSYSSKELLKIFYSIHYIFIIVCTKTMRKFNIQNSLHGYYIIRVNPFIFFVIKKNTIYAVSVNEICCSQIINLRLILKNLVSHTTNNSKT